jgi:hypothetical protein
LSLSPPFFVAFIAHNKAWFSSVKVSMWSLLTFLL